MEKFLIVGFCTLLILAATGAPPAFAAEDPVAKDLQKAVETFAQGCEVELSTWCEDVTPGEGRLLACLYARQDKLSSRCEFAIYDSAAQLERTLNSLNFTVNECRDDLRNYCLDIQPGEGRLLDCLDRNEAKVSDRCKSALKAVGVR
jgi:hypothetical protein